MLDDVDGRIRHRDMQPHGRVTPTKRAQRGEDAEYRSVIVLHFPMHVSGDVHHYARLLRTQFQNHHHLFVRLKQQPQFIFMDLYRMFTNWDLITKEIAGACADVVSVTMDAAERRRQEVLTVNIIGRRVLPSGIESCATGCWAPSKPGRAFVHQAADAHPRADEEEVSDAD